jgi:uncharacterized membrane protein
VQPHIIVIGIKELQTLDISSLVMVDRQPLIFLNIVWRLALAQLFGQVISHQGKVALLLLGFVAMQGAQALLVA